MAAEFQVIELQIPAELAGERLDAALARLMPDHSRTRIKGWIETGQVLVGQLPCKPRDVVEAGSRINVRRPVDLPRPSAVLPEHIPLTLLYEDEDVLVVDKPVGLVVHPGAGNHSHTLQNALLLIALFILIEGAYNLASRRLWSE